MRRRYQIGLVLLALCLALLAAASWMVGSESGSRWLLSRVLDRMPATVEVAAINGRLADRLVLQGIQATWEAGSLELEELVIDWSPIALTRKHLQINALHLDSIILKTQEAGTPDPSGGPGRLTWPEFPGWLQEWQFDLDALTITTARLQRPPEALRLEQLEAVVRMRQGRVIVEDLVANAGGHRCRGRLAVDAFGPSIETTIQASPVTGEWHADISLTLEEGPPDTIMSGPFNGQLTLEDQPGYRFAGNLALAADQGRVTNLTFERPEHDGVVAGELRVDWSAPPRLIAALTIRDWLLPEAANAPTIQGRVNGQGPLDALVGDFALRLTGARWQDGDIAGTWTGAATGIDLAIESGRWLAGTVAGDLRLRWDGLPGVDAAFRLRQLDPALLAEDWSGDISLDAELSVQQEDDGLAVTFQTDLIDSRLRNVPLEGVVMGSWRGDQLILDRLDLDGDGFNVTASGALADRLTLALDIRDLGGLVPQATGQLAAKGWIRRQDSEWLGDVSARANALHIADIRFDAADLSLRRPSAGDPYELTLTAEEAGYDDFTLTTLQAEASGTLDRHRLRLSAVAPQGPLRISANGQRRGSLWQATIDDLFVAVTGASPWQLAAPAALTINEQFIEISEARLQNDHGAMTASARVARDGRPVRLEISAEQIPLAIFDPVLGPWSVAGDLDARVNCSEDTCTLDARGLETIRHAGQALHFRQVAGHGAWDEDGLQAEFDLQTDAAGTLSLMLDSTMPFAWQRPENGSINVTFVDLDPYPLLTLAEQAAFTGRLTGDVQADWNRDVLSAMQIHLAGSLEWPITATRTVAMDLLADGEWNDNGLTLSLASLLEGGGRVTFSGSADTPPNRQTPWPLQWSLSWSDIPLERLHRFPTDLEVEGFWQGRARGTLNEALHFDHTGTTALRDARLTWHDEDSEAISFAVDEAGGDWQWTGTTLQGSMQIVMAERGQVSGSWQLPWPARWPLAPRQSGLVGGHLGGWFHENGLLGLLWPQYIQNTRGDIDIDLLLAGTWDDPVLAGSIRLHQGGGYLPGPGITLDEVTLTAHFDDQDLVIERLEARSAPGQITGQGRLTLQGWQPRNLDFSITGDNFTLADIPQLQMRVSPDLQLGGTAEDMLLSGTIGIPYFLATGRSERTPVPVSPDVVIVGSPTDESEALPVSLTTRVQLDLGDQVLVKMFGLDARLGGQLELTGIDPQHFTAHGEIHVEEGSYATYGVKLDIEKGLAAYAGGPLDNPAINILAVKKANEVKAGVRIFGTAKNPEVKLYSEPALPDTDVLSYIVLGRPLNQAGGETDPLMLAAGAFLSASDSAVLRSQLQNDLGIDTLEAVSETGETTDTVLRLGKYLTPDLYLSYGYALFGQRSEVGLRYHLYKGWEAESKFGLESGADLFYRFQFD